MTSPSTSAPAVALSPLEKFSRHCFVYYTMNPPPPSSSAVLSAFASLQSCPTQPPPLSPAHSAAVSSCGLLVGSVDLEAYASAQAKARSDAHAALASARKDKFAALLSAPSPSGPKADVASGMMGGARALRGKNAVFEASLKALVEAQVGSDEVLAWKVGYYFFEEMEVDFLEKAWSLLNAVGNVEADAEEQVVTFSLGEGVSDSELKKALRGVEGGVKTGVIEGTERRRTNREGGSEWRCCIIL